MKRARDEAMGMPASDVPRGSASVDKKPSRPFKREARNLWVMSPRDDGLPDDAAHAERIVGALGQAICAFRQLAREQGAQLRLITGGAGGMDASAAGMARKYGCEWHVVAPSWTEGAMQPERVATITEAPGAAPDAALAAADEARLGYADAAVVLGEGAPLRNYSAERDGILVEALCRHMPIVWIDTSAQGAGATWILRPQALDELAVTTLGKDAEQVRRIAGFFSEVDADQLAGEMAELLAIYWNADTILAIDAMLRGDYGDPGRGATWKGMFYTTFLRLFGNWKVKFFSPVEAQRGPPELVLASQFPADTWDWYDRIDRAATYAAYSHRDQVVVVNLAASLAVFFAVAGQVWPPWKIWPVAELFMLWIIFRAVYGNRHRQLNNHDRWLHFRQSAEALRLSALLHPLLASLPLLHRGVWKYDAAETPRPVLDKPFHWLVIQLLRDTGIPGREGPHSIEAQFHDLVDSLDALISDQDRYHARSRRLRQTHHHLRHWIERLFWLVVAWVVFHLVIESCHAPAAILRPACELLQTHRFHGLRWPLFLTAFLPALAAAMHGIASKAELQRLAKNSDRMQRQLTMLRRSIEGVRRHHDPLALRALAIQAAATMYAEHDAWAELMSDQPLELV